MDSLNGAGRNTEGGSKARETDHEHPPNVNADITCLTDSVKLSRKLGESALGDRGTKKKAARKGDRTIT